MSAPAKVSKRGVELYNAGRYAEAIICFEKEVKAGRDDAVTRRFLAHAYASVGRTGDAVRQLRAAFRRGSDPSAVFDALRMIMGKASRFGETEENLMCALEKAPSSAGMRLALGGLHLEQGRLRQAEVNLRAALRHDPRSEQALLMLGRLLEARGMDKEAEKIYRKVDSAEARLKLGELYLRRGRLEEAERTLRQGAQSTTALLLLGRVLEARGDGRAAEKRYRKALELAPDLPEPRQRLGELYLHQGKHERAEELLRQTAGAQAALLLAEMQIGQGKPAAAEKTLLADLRRRPNDPRLLSKLGWLYHQMERPADFRAVFKRFLAAADQGHPHRFLARVAIEDYKGALREAEQALAVRKAAVDDRLFHPWADDWFPPRKPAFYEGQLEKVAALPVPWRRFFRGLLLGYLERYRESLSEFDGISARGAKRWGWMRYAPGLQRLQLRDYPAAVEDLRAALASRPDMWMARCHLAEAYLCLGEPAQAFREFAAAEKRGDDVAAANVRVWRGEALLWLGRCDEALRELDRENRDVSAFAFAWSGAARMLLGDPERALADLNRAAAGGAHDAEVYLWRGELHRRQGRHAEALVDLDRSLELGGLAWARVNRALTCAALGRDAEMWRDFEAIPHEVLALGAEELPRGLDKRGIVRLLEAALAAAGGVRRPEPYTLDALKAKPRRGRG
ncbi:MAG: tetratricopeptide repeat protein [Elusimicrobiota bacterium]